MKSKKVFVLVLFVLFSFSLFAIELDPVVKAAFSSESAVGNYVQTKRFAKSSRSLVSSGTIQLAPGYGIVWYAEKPYKSVLVISKDKMVQQIKDGKPVHSPVESNQIYTTIASAFECVFFGDFSEAEKLFSITQTVDNGNWKLVLRLSDDNLKSYMDYIEMTGSSNLQSLLVVEKTGDSILYEINSVERRALSEQEIAVYEL